ncbi:hypothetical protein ES705_24380 [subsurface metagenome]
MRKLLVLLLVLSMVLFFIGLADAQYDGRKITIGYTPIAYDPTDLFGFAETSCKKYLDKAGINYKWILRPPSHYVAHEEQYDIVRNFITMGVDIVWLGPTALDVQRPSIKLLAEANIPVIIITTLKPISERGQAPWPDDELPVLTWTAEDHFKIGEMIAEWTINRLNGEGTMAIIYGPPGDPRTLGRGYLAKKIIEEKSNIKVVYEHHADFLEEKAFRATEHLLIAHPDIDLIFGMSSDMGQGVISAVKIAGKLDQIDVISVGGIHRELKAIIAGDQTMTVYRDPISIGRGAGEAIVLWLNGKEVPEAFSSDLHYLESVEDIRKYVPEEYFDVDAYLAEQKG